MHVAHYIDHCLVRLLCTSYCVSIERLIPGYVAQNVLCYICILRTYANMRLILLLIGTGMFTFICMLALGATAWLNAAAQRRPAARTVSTYIELVGTVIILIG